MRRFSSSLMFFLILIASSQELASAGAFKVLTLNTWLLPAILGTSQDRELRKSLMPSSLASSGADLIALQEVWTTEDQDFLVSQMAERGYPHAIRVNYDSGGIFGLGRGMMGNGLLAFSKHEVRSAVHFFPFSGFTRAAEYFAAKGVMHFEVKLPEAGWVDFYNVHLGAVYFDSEKREWSSEQLKSHELQGKELLKFVLETRSNSTQIIAGDLNIHPYEWDSKPGAFSRDRLMPLYAHITGEGSKDQMTFLDTFHQVNSGSEAAFTYDRNFNSYVAQGAFKSDPSLFCDYVLINRNQNHVVAQTSEIVFNRPLSGIEGGPHFLSDHFGVITEFKTRPLIDGSVDRL